MEKIGNITTKMVDGLGSEVKEGINKLIDEDDSQPHKNFMDFLKS